MLKQQQQQKKGASLEILREVVSREGWGKNAKTNLFSCLEMEIAGNLCPNCRLIFKVPQIYLREIDHPKWRLLGQLLHIFGSIHTVEVCTIFHTHPQCRREPLILPVLPPASLPFEYANAFWKMGLNESRNQLRCCPSLQNFQLMSWACSFYAFFPHNNDHDCPFIWRHLLSRTLLETMPQITMVMPEGQ